MMGKNMIVNKHGIKMHGLKETAGITRRTKNGRIYWSPDTGAVSTQHTPGALMIMEYKAPMSMQSIADAVAEEAEEEEKWKEVAIENGWRVKE